jgi:GT2 family glycosyltransferase
MRIQWIESDSIFTAQELFNSLRNVTGSFICLAKRENFQKIDTNKLQRELEWSDVIHSGLLYEGKDAFTDIQSLTVNWNFLTPNPKLSSNSWKATSEFIIFNSSSLDLAGGIDKDFDTANAALMDFVYRLLMSGARVINNPTYFSEPSLPVKTITNRDVTRFIRKHFPKSALFFYKLITRRLGGASVLNVPTFQDIPDRSQFKLVAAKQRSIDKFTAIIPTLNRYLYLAQAIQSLLDSTFPPTEIIVVDQTPKEKRIAGYYDSFLKSDFFKVVFLDETGQAISRNTGIDMSSCEWIYLFDDDSVCWPECLEEHQFLLEHSASDVSTGLSLAPWKDRSYLKGNVTYYRIADVLDTGNCFIKKSVLLAVGKIDTAFNKGPGADDDLGKRLYLGGYQIVLNPKAIRTHYKAKTGGLREHGAWWRNTSKLMEAYPPPTQLYMIRKYYTREKWFAQVLLFYFLSRKKTNSFTFLLSLFLAPLKYRKALSQVKVLES